MSLALVIENIDGSLRQLAPAAEAGTLAGKTAAESRLSAGQAVATADQAGFNEPTSGQIQLTPGFSVVVLQLLNEQGNVVATVPTAQQLAAYRNGTATPPA
jgi:hypothetical protein